MGHGLLQDAQIQEKLIRVFLSFKECQIEVLRSKLDWANENDPANMFSQVFTITSQDYDQKLRPINGVYTLTSYGENINFSMYFTSNTNPENFVEFTLDCERIEE